MFSYKNLIPSLLVGTLRAIRLESWDVPWGTYKISLVETWGEGRGRLNRGTRCISFSFSNRLLSSAKKIPENIVSPMFLHVSSFSRSLPHSVRLAFSPSSVSLAFSPAHSSP